jgi:IS1 family transposase
MGHILANQSKLINFKFLSEKTNEFKKLPINVEVSKIQFINEINDDWDTSQTIIRYVSKQE